MAISSNVFCKAPWISLQNDPRGFFNVCCVYADYSGIGSVENGWKAAWTGKKLEKIRKGFVDRDPFYTDKCKHCIAYEKVGGSQRQSCDYYDSLVQEQTLGDSIQRGPVFLDLRFSTICNQSCVMCGPHASSRWASNLHIKPVIMDSKPLVSLVQDNIQTVKVIRFAGGEPLIVPEHYEILKLLIDAGRTDVKLVYNTNLSKLTFGKFNVLDLWTQFPNKEITISVDAVRERNDYIRFGSSWNVFEQNCKDVLQACSSDQVFYHPTIQILNIVSIPELFKFVEDVGGEMSKIILGNILTAPQELSLFSLQRDVRERILSSVCIEDYKNPFIQESWKKLVTAVEGNGVDYNLPIEKTIKYLDWIDGLHKTSWKDTFPELVSILR